MALHINLFFVILFANISLSLAAPDLVLGENPFFTENPSGEYVIDNEFQQRLEDANPAQQTGLLDTGAAVFSGLFLIFDFIGLLFKVLFSSLFILFVLPPTVGLIIGVPVFLAYALALIGFIRGA